MYNVTATYRDFSICPLAEYHLKVILKMGKITVTLLSLSCTAMNGVNESRSYSLISFKKVFDIAIYAKSVVNYILLVFNYLPS